MNNKQYGKFAALVAFALFAGHGFTQTTSNPGRHVFSIAESTTTHSSPVMQTKFLLTAEQSGGRFSIVDEVFAPGLNSHPGHHHTFHSEVFYVMTGSMEMTVDGDAQVLGPGDLVFIPPNAVHAVRVLGDSDAHVLMIFEPGGYELGYRARRAVTDEELRDPEAMQRVRQLQDLVPAERE